MRDNYVRGRILVWYISTPPFGNASDLIKILKLIIRIGKVFSNVIVFQFVVPKKVHTCFLNTLISYNIRILNINSIGYYINK